MSTAIPSSTLKIDEIIDRSEQMLDRLEAQVDELLDVAGISSGNLVLARAKCDLQRLVLRLTDQYREQLLAAGCLLSVDSTGPAIGFWDERRLEGAIGNLLANAMKYAPGKPIEVTLRTQPGLAVLTVRDHGIGIDLEAQSRIFNLFERAVSSHHYGGLGLGLYIARKALEAHGGSIHVKSAPGQGAEFTIELPIAGS